MRAVKQADTAARELKDAMKARDPLESERSKDVAIPSCTPLATAGFVAQRLQKQCNLLARKTTR